MAFFSQLRILFLILFCYHAVSYRLLPSNRYNSVPDVRLDLLSKNAAHFADNQRWEKSVASKMSKIVEFSDSDRESIVMSVLAEVIDPEAGTDIVDAGYVSSIVVSDNNEVTDVTVMLSTKSDLVRQLCILQLTSQLEWATGIIEVNSFKEPPKAPVVVEDVPLMKQVKNVIAVSSCKGGVGKSTVSVNLAFTLRNKGYKVGILDADIYGPSLPTMTRPDTESAKLYQDNRLVPLEYEGVKLLSLGFINKGAAIMRGPMVNQILNQFVTLCDWGELDYLIIDMPPGTGDIQLTLAQIMDISGAVIVTTPQRLSFVDVVKGIDMFDTVNVPCVAVVENMAEYATYEFDEHFFTMLAEKAAQAADVGGDRAATVQRLDELLTKAVSERKTSRRLFGEGHTQRLRDMWGMDTIISLPLLDEISKSGDSGLPYVLSNPDSRVAKAIDELADGVLKELANAENGRQSLAFDEETSVFTLQIGDKDDNKDHNKDKDKDKEAVTASAYDLRCDCRCAVCVEELTGRALLDRKTVSPKVRPIGGMGAMANIGRYAAKVDWSDGHKSLYPFRQIISLSKVIAGKKETIKL
jgi:Mrp family chromosome partitioning ATPase